VIGAVAREPNPVNLRFSCDCVVSETLQTALPLLAITTTIRKHLFAITQPIAMRTQQL
jgi:hypothetical protein